MTKKKIKNIISKIVGYILNLLLTIVSILIIVGIYYIFQIKILNKDYADMCGYTFFEVATGSMADTIEIGDVIIVKFTKDIEEKDIIVYKDNENFITHRLVKKEDEKLIAKGDANNSEDKPITIDQVLGKVIYIIPKIGIWKKVLLSPEVLGLTTVVIILLGFTFMCTSKTEEEKNE